MAKFKLEGREYESTNLSAQVQKMFVNLAALNERIQETQNLIAVLNKAKKAYIADLKSEMLSAKAGFDFSGD